MIIVSLLVGAIVGWLAALLAGTDYEMGSLGNLKN